MKPKKTPPNQPRRRGPNFARILYMGYLCVCLSVCFASPASAATIWEKASEIMQDVYTQILTISTSLSCSLVRLMAEQMPDGEPPASPGMPLDPRIWYDQQGRETLEMLIADLNSRGYKHLALKEDGSICTSLDGANEETIQSTFSNFPAKVYWPQLAKVLEQEGLAATVEANCVSVAW